jgi:hypothetical protein
MSWSNRGIVLDQLGRYAEALESHKKARFYYAQLDYQPGVDRARAEIERLRKLANPAR